MSRSLESIMAAHHAAAERRRQGRPVWDHTVYLGDVFHVDALTFPQRRDGVVARLRGSTWYDTAGQEGSELADLLDELATAADTDEFDEVWDSVYELADRDRAWIDTAAGGPRGEQQR